MDITAIEAQNEMAQGDTYAIAWDFALASTEAGRPLTEGETIEVKTNIDELFTVDYGTLKPFSIFGTDDAGAQVTLATVTLSAGKATFTVATGGDGMQEIEGQITTTTSLTARDLGATVGKPVEHDLRIGNADTKITFIDKDKPAGSESLDLVDVDTFWKNMFNRGVDTTVGVACMEVNPIGSLDLYGSTTYTPADPAKPRKPRSYENLFVKDEIPEHGFIDTASIQIYAAVPTLMRYTGETYTDKWHADQYGDPYTITSGTYYAQRSGTQRYNILDRMTLIKQAEGETLAKFEARVRGRQLSWGIFTATDKTQTFMANFGTIGKGAAADNGITYESLGGRGAEYARNYPQIFGAQGASGGTVVSYYVEFDTYYPEIVGQRALVNTAELTQMPAGATTPARVGGNGAPYTINNGGGFGIARKNELLLKLEDAQTREPIAGATFAVERQAADGTWQRTVIEGTTDAEGMLRGADGALGVGTFTNGTYRVVQTSWAHGYEESTVYGPSESDKMGSPDASGVFTITGQERFGFATVATNTRKTGELTLEPQSMVAYTGGDSLANTTFPAVRYRVTGASDDEVAGLTFYADGVEIAAEQAGSFWVLPGLATTFTGEDGAAADDRAAGVYTIGVAADAITAEGADGTSYTVTVEDGATCTVRNVSTPAEVISGSADVAQPVVARAEDVDTTDGIGVAQIAPGTAYFTNGNEDMGVLGDAQSDEPQVALLFDELLPGEEGEDTAQLLRDRAADEGIELTEDNAEFRYLDLVNENDGNAWMSTEDGAQITIYWPVPEQLRANVEDYTFEVLHFTGLHREYRGDMEAQVAASDVERIACRVEGDNIVFTLTGDKDAGCFSPFAVTWERAAAPAPVNEPPSIEADDVIIYVGDAYDASMHQAKAKDAEDGDLTDKIVLADDGDVDRMTPGTYTVTFAVTDSDGARATTTAKVLVLPKQDDSKPGDSETGGDDTGTDNNTGGDNTGGDNGDASEGGEDKDAGTGLPTTGDAASLAGVFAAAGAIALIEAARCKRRDA